jgi:hypothetical protein
MLSPVPEEVEENGGNSAPVVDVGEDEGVRRKPAHIELNACHQPMLRDLRRNGEKSSSQIYPRKTGYGERADGQRQVSVFMNIVLWPKKSW